jgi:hypothetical protein
MDDPNTPVNNFAFQNNNNSNNIPMTQQQQQPQPPPSSLQSPLGTTTAAAAATMMMMPTQMMANELTVIRKAGRQAIRAFLESHNCFAVLRISGKVVVFDTRIPIQLAFYALVEHGEFCCYRSMVVRQHILSAFHSHLL